MRWTGSPTGARRAGGEDAWRSAAARPACPRVSPPPGAPVSAELGPTPRSSRASTKEPRAPSARQGSPRTLAGPDASFPPWQGSSSTRGQSQEEASVSPPRVRRSGCPSGSLQTAPQKGTACGCAFLGVGEGHFSSPREKCLATHREICFEEPNEKSHFSTAVSRFAVCRRLLNFQGPVKMFFLLKRCFLWGGRFEDRRDILQSLSPDGNKCKRQSQSWCCAACPFFDLLIANLETPRRGLHIAV